jgi:hypothetical protein
VHQLQPGNCGLFRLRLPLLLEFDSGAGEQVLIDISGRMDAHEVSVAEPATRDSWIRGAACSWLWHTWRVGPRRRQP